MNVDPRAQVTDKPEPTSPEQLFAKWLEQRKAHKRDRLSEKAAEPYRRIWLSWNDWLDETPPGQTRPRARSYLEAKPEHVVDFLSRGLSDVTRRRYWRVLQRIYNFAKEEPQALIKQNPTEAITPRDTPAPEDTEGLVLNRTVWVKLPKYLPKGQDRVSIRDRALLLLFMDLALTPQEACRLECDQVQGDLLLKGRLVVHVDGKRGKNQERTLTASAETSAALLAWANERVEINRASRSQEAQEVPFAPKGKAANLLFITLRGTPMTRRTLFHLVAAFITRACEGEGAGAPDHHRGPLVLRNSRLVEWLWKGRDPASVVLDAGLESVKGLHRLRAHLPPSVRADLFPRTYVVEEGGPNAAISELPSNARRRATNN